ncbi:MAG: Rieske (2Fe-2S) protein [Alphaproteobacteria bacterium]|nr:Rieske (2Fe-2S) protein [Alphaproteobacteria bacterium]MBO6627036.1 Rieske (2Fe-2S) protein [Alphaproteobacteria bacterium]MDF1626471.1 Rieske (2Fe-2S) protein [Parvibaculaceae bacterium]|tara:strand:+ start:162 stop:593 length:432 start_codon:yes stop_codon:yes gene_type:complete
MPGTNSETNTFGDTARREKWRAKAPSQDTFLCHLSDIENPGAKGLTFGEGRERFDMFLVRRDKKVRAYVNACPHAFTTLETFTDRFLTRAKDQILCTTHGALFNLEDGFCTSGPCEGKSLEPLPIKIEGERILMGRIRTAETN